MAVTARKLPRQKRAKATVECILAAAAHILRTTYPEGFNTNDIAARAGVSIGSLYQYFPSKEALSLALIIQEKSKVLAEIEGVEGLPSTVTFAEALTQLLRGLVQFHVDAGLLHRNLEIEERRLLSNSELQAINLRISDANRNFFSRHLNPAGQHENFMTDTANDIRSIVQAVLESELRKEGTDISYLFLRVSRAVFGYLHAMGQLDLQPSLRSAELD